MRDVRFDNAQRGVFAAALFLASSCGGDDGTAANGAPASSAGGSENGGATSSRGGTAATAGRNQGTGGLASGTGSRPSANGGSAASGGGGISGTTNTGGTIGDASVGGASGTDGSLDASAAGGGSGAGGTTSSGGTGGDRSSGGVTSDASGNLCGTIPCASTRCAAWNCGAAVCCARQSEPVCIHGTTTCPNPDGGGDSATLQCWGGVKDAYAFSRSCTQKSDCFVAEYWAGCCNIHAVGLHTSEQSRFDSFETNCGTPTCGCCCDRVTADDGTVVASGTTIGVDCVAGLCRTTAP